MALNARGLVEVSDTHETSIPGIYAAGDLTMHPQAAILAAAAGMQAAARINHDLTVATGVTSGNTHSGAPESSD